MSLQPTTGSELFAVARGRPVRRGGYRCFYCGAACDDTLPAGDYVKKTCTIRQYVAAPDSDYVCAGCAASKQEKTTVPVHGEEKPRRNTRVRLYSWVITRERAEAATKAHVGWLQQVCMEPPAPPFAIALSTSGQRHVVYWTKCNVTREHVTVNLEMERVTYRPSALTRRINLTESLVAASGKTRLEGRPDARLAMKVQERYGDLERYEQWTQVWGESLSRLAVFLSRKREDCQNDWENIEASPRTDSEGIPTAAGGSLFD